MSGKNPIARKIAARPFLAERLGKKISPKLSFRSKAGFSLVQFSAASNIRAVVRAAAAEMGMLELADSGRLRRPGNTNTSAFLDRG
jgi:hypothetical protein